MSLHKNLPYTEVHVAYAFSYADSTARTAATGFLSGDVGKIARQLDNNSLWMLTNYSPIAWKDVGSGVTSGDVYGPGSSTDNAIVRFHETTGKSIQNSSVTIDDSGNISTSGTVDGRDLSTDGSKLDGIASGATNTPLSSSNPTQIDASDTAVSGVSTSAARADHQHAVNAAATGDLVAVDAGTASGGSSTTLARGDHKHSVSVGTPSTLTVGGSNTGGSATTLVRSDHLHGLPAFGTGSGNFCEGNDSRLSDDRTASALRSATTVVNVSSATAPTTGQVLTATSSTTAVWSSASSSNGRIVQQTFDEITADTTTTSLTFVTLLTRTLTTGANKLNIHFTCAGSNSSNNTAVHFEIQIDGVSIRGSALVASSAATQSTSIVYSTTVTAASHTIDIKWKVPGGTGRVRPVTTVIEHASLLIQEIN